MIKAATLPDDQIDQIENKINALLKTPAFAGYSLASAFLVPGSDNDSGTIVFIFQKPN